MMDQAVLNMSDMMLSKRNNLTRQRLFKMSVIEFIDLST